MVGEIAENTDENKIQVKHKSLLAKYEIPIDHLSYEYIRACNHVKELERIVKILRSGEEGHFPDLQKTAEERLGLLSPNNRLLRTEEPALDKSCFNKQEWANILGDIDNWKKEVSVRDKQLCNDDDLELGLPPVRQPLLAKQPADGDNAGKQQKQKKKVGDYSFWDKYDVDTELLKLDLEEERKKSTEKETKSVKETESDRLKVVVEEAKKCTETEKLILAEQEKIRGNEYYQAKDYVQAEKYYTASLAIHPTANVYNNRASCYLKQNKNEEAVRDADCTLKLEPNNVKALFRKGIALKNMNENQEALENMNAVLRQEPSQSQARNIARQLTDKIKEDMKATERVKDKFNRKENTKLPSIEMNSEITRCFEVNEWGLPKTPCRCFGHLKCNIVEDKTDPQPSLLPGRSRTLEKISQPARIIELADENEQPVQKHSSKIEIIEISPPHHEPLSFSKDFCVPKKCNIVDKRTRKASFEHGGGDMT